MTGRAAHAARPAVPLARGLRELLRLDAGDPNGAAKRDAIADEVEARRAPVLLGAVHTGFAALVEHAEVPDERLQPGAEARGRDDGVDLDRATAGEHGTAVVEALQGRHDADAAGSHRIDEPDVEDREHLPAQEVR